MASVYPSEHPLGSAAAKVAWADMHIQRLLDSLRDSLNPEVSYRRKHKLKGELWFSGAELWELTVDPNSVGPWNMIAGDIVGALRASLDHIAWALATKDAADREVRLTADQERGVTFPLGNRPGKFSLSFSVPDGASDAIERFQPYNRTERAELELLAVLDDLSRMDKHRTIFDPRRRVSVFLSDDQPITFIGLDKPTTQLFIETGHRRDDFEPKVTFHEVLHPSVRGHRGFSLSEFADIHDFIRDKVLPAFAGFFEKPNAGGGQDAPPDSASTVEG